ncbi:MAG: protein-glutamate O-methyltransferase CheR [Pseudomonadota bacterium]
MSADINPQEYAAFRDFLEHVSGIVLGENKQYLVNSRLRSLLGELGIKSVGELLGMMDRSSGVQLRQRVIDAMTTHETLWFRDQYPFEALKRMILPELTKADLPTLRIWSAACASGQEPYSISMICEEFRLEYPRRPLGTVQILATDISPTILQLAREGVYDSIALGRGLTQDRRERFFITENDKAKIKPAMMRQVTFRELNLMQPFKSLGKFHVIFCRNVMIYFSDQLKVDILGRIAEVLEPNGYLFLGGSESITRYCDRFEVSRAHGGMVFRLKS